jgi:hypothetical protein
MDFGHPDETGVRVIHGNVSVFFEESPNRGGLRLEIEIYLENAPGVKGRKSIAGRSRVAEEVPRFDQHCFAGEQPGRK